MAAAPDTQLVTILINDIELQVPKGEIIVEYRNSSNGYYGGWLEGPVE